VTEEVIIGDCRLILGDCREVLPGLPKHDLLLTDPPYGIGHKHSGKAKGKWDKANSHQIFMDDSEFNPRPFFVAPDVIMFGGDHFARHLPPGGVFHVWDKECGRTNRFDSFSDAEIFWTSFACKRRVIRYMWKGLQVENPTQDQERFHPTQKPVEVMMQIAAMRQRAETVCDPFMGSGTTGVACIRLGKSFTGIERERKYFDIACERIENAYRQAPLVPHVQQAKHVQEALL
jgi:site-specific DNA-methyltransferase (adenine-specific)/modification methylase